MPRYYFPIVDGVTLDDPVGIELDNDQKARLQADRIARQLALVQESKKARNVVAIDEEGNEFYKAPVNPES